MTMTTKVKPTPGPWESSGLTLYEANGEHRDICEMFSCHEHTVSITEDEALANARLISAAPDMLASLEELFAEIRDGHYVEGSLKRAEAAIQKARGEK